MEPNQQIPEAAAPERKKSYGGMLAILLIIALIVIGALYAWGERIAKNGDLSPSEEEMLQELEEQDASTEPEAIRADLEAATADEFGEDFDEAFAELDAAFEAE